MRRRVLASLLTVAAFVSFALMPASASPMQEADWPTWIVTAFEPLDESKALQNLSAAGEPDLPDALIAWAYKVALDVQETVLSEQTGTDEEVEIVSRQITIPNVTWTAEPELDSTIAGVYRFTPVLPATYAVAADVALPTVLVTVETGQLSSVERLQALFDALPAPESINADNRSRVEAQLAAIDEERLELTDRDLDQLDVSKYKSVATVLVTMDGQAAANGIMTVADGTTYDVSTGPVTITQSGTYTITGTSTTNNVCVAKDVTATLILSDVNIDVSATENKAAVDLSSAGACTITLAEGTTNTLKSWRTVPGICAPNGKQVTFNGSGVLDVTGAPGIGRQDYWRGSTDDRINILIMSGNITAHGSDHSAGIGGGQYCSGGTIIIQGGTVTAYGDGWGAGIGGGLNATVNNITISGGTVTARGGGGAAGIGGGYNATGSGSIIISGGTVSAQGQHGGIGRGEGPAEITFGTGTDCAGSAFIIASSISDKSSAGSWQGVILEGKTGHVYGSPILVRDAEVPSGTTLTVPADSTLTIGSGVKLTNNGTINNSGTIVIQGDITGNGKLPVSVNLDANGGSVEPNPVEVYYGRNYSALPQPKRDGYSFTGWYTAQTGGTCVTNDTKVEITESQTLYARWTENKSKVIVTFSDSNPAYGSTINIAATIAAANSNSLRSVSKDTVEFSLGSTILGTSPVSNNRAVLKDVSINGDTWKPSTKKISAKFGGSLAYTGSSGSNDLTVKKGTPTVIAPVTNKLTYTGSAQNLISSGTTTGGTLQYSLDNSTWNTSIPTGTDVGAYTVYYRVEGGDCYNDVALQSVTAVIALRQEDTPQASIDYGTEKLTGLTSGTKYTVTPVDGATNEVEADAEGKTAVQDDWFGKTLSIVKLAQNDNYSDSEAQNLTVPERPDPPVLPLALIKTSSSISITGNECAGCEFAIDNGSWQASAAFSSLQPGIEHHLVARIKATDSNFRSDSVGQSITTVAADGSTTLKPGETVETGTPTSTVTNDGDKITINPASPNDGFPTAITVPQPDGDEVEVRVNEDGNVEAPGGTIVKTGEGPEITIGPANGGTIGGDGSVVVPEGGSIQVGDDPVTTITLPEGGKVKPNGDGTLEIPGGSTVKTEDGPEIIIGPENGGTIDSDGVIIVPEGGTIKIGQDPVLTVTLPDGGEMKPNKDGTIEVPGGTTVQPGSGPAITIGPENGGTISGGGIISLPQEGSVQTGEDPITVIKPPADGEVQPNEDGTIEVPGGTTVKTGENPEITVGPENGGTIGDDGAVMVPEGGTIQIGENPTTTVTVPEGGEVKSTEDGGVTIPGGSTIKVGDADSVITVPEAGGEIKSTEDGGVIVPGGSTITIDASYPVITVPEAGGEVKSAEDGGVIVPGGSTVTVGEHGPIVTLPEDGGEVQLTENGVVVPGGSTVTPMHGGSVTVVPDGGGEVRPATKPGGHVPPTPAPTFSVHLTGKDTINVGEDVTLTASFSQAVAADGITWNISPADTKHNISADRKTITVLDARAGDIVAEVTGTWNGRTASASKTVHVLGDIQVAIMGPDTIQTDEDAVFTTTPSGNVDNSDISWAVDAADCAMQISADRRSVTVRPSEPGTMTVSVHVTQDGRTGTARKSVRVLASVLPGPSVTPRPSGDSRPTQWPTVTPVASATPSPIASGTPSPSARPGMMIPDPPLLMTNEDGVYILRGVPFSTPQAPVTVGNVHIRIRIPDEARLEILDRNGNVCNFDAVASTGQILCLIDADGNVMQLAVIVVQGDVLGTGTMCLTQLVRAAQVYGGKVDLDGPYLKAADWTGSGTVSLADLVQEANAYREAVLIA